jgi:cysteine dioxygenase
LSIFRGWSYVNGDDRSYPIPDSTWYYADASPTNDVGEATALEVTKMNNLAMRETNPTDLDGALSYLDTFQDAIPLEELHTTVQPLQLDLSNLTRYLHFGKKSYLRNLIHEGPCYQALLLCWRSGQRSPIHDHAGSACALKVVQGKALETVFKRGPNGMIYACSSDIKGEGETVASFDADIHQISNLEPDGCDLVTLHIYSPPLLVMGKYSLTESIVTPWHETNYIPLCNDGAGI